MLGAYNIYSLRVWPDTAVYIPMTSHTSAGINAARKRESRGSLNDHRTFADYVHRFCRKTTMTKHIRKEHPTESVQEDQDAEYSDVEPSDDEEFEDESDEIKEEPQTLYQEPMHAKKMHLDRRPNEYNRNLWSLPGQTAQRPSPIHTSRSTIPLSEGLIQEIKLERTSSATPQRSLTDSYPDNAVQTSEFSLSRAATMPNGIAVPSTIPQSQTNGTMSQRYLLRNTDSNGSLWSPQHAMQDSPTSLNHSSPSSASTQSHPMFTSQPFQLQSVEVPSQEPMQYPNHHEVLVSNTIQPLNDLTVHEIHLDEPQQQQYPDMAPTPVHQNPYDGAIQHVTQQDQFMAMSREASQHNIYEGQTPQSAIQQYRDELPSTPAPTQQIQHYATSLAESPFPQFAAHDSFPTNTQVFPLNDLFQYNQPTNEWWKDNKLEENGWILPNQRVPEFERWGS